MTLSPGMRDFLNTIRVDSKSRQEWLEVLEKKIIDGPDAVMDLLQRIDTTINDELYPTRNLGPVIP